jgi:hypothetical protein
LFLPWLPPILLQTYLSQKPYPLITINQISNIKQYPYARYFKIKNISIDKKYPIIADHHTHTN